jgi:hypothetical protein
MLRSTIRSRCVTFAQRSSAAPFAAALRYATTNTAWSGSGAEAGSSSPITSNARRSDGTGIPYRVPAQFDVEIKNVDKCQDIINEAFSVQQLRKQHTLVLKTLEAKRREVDRLRAQKAELDIKAEKYPFLVSWAVGGFLVVQFVTLFKWVFFDFDWNLVEPVTYFLGYTGTTFFALMFYRYTGKDFSYDNLWGNMAEANKQKLYRDAKFDPAQLESLEKSIKELEELCEVIDTSLLT